MRWIASTATTSSWRCGRTRWQTAFTAGLLLATEPVWVMVLGYAFLAERAGTRAWLGSAVALGGVVIPARPGRHWRGPVWRPRDSAPATAALSALQPGDTLVFWKSDRWGRSAAHVLTTINELRDRGVTVKSLTENFDLDTKGRPVHVRGHLGLGRLGRRAGDLA